MVKGHETKRAIKTSTCCKIVLLTQQLSNNASSTQSLPMPASTPRVGTSTHNNANRIQNLSTCNYS